MTSRWYVIRTKPQCEYTAAAALEGKGFEYFFPRVKTPEPPGGRQDTPLFPGYIFLSYDLEARGRTSISRLPGVIGWLRFDEVVPHVPDEAISKLAQRVDEINQSGGLWTRFQPGEIVRVISGKMDSLAQVLEEPKSPEARVRVLMDFMGRMVPTQVGLRDLRPASQESNLRESGRGNRRTRGRGRWIQGFGPRAAVGV